MLVLSPLVTAARASAPMAPAFSRSSRSNPEPTMRGPVPVLESPEGPGVLVHDGHGVALGGRGRRPGRNRPGHTRRRSRARHSTTRDAGLCKGAAVRGRTATRWEPPAVCSYCVRVPNPGPDPSGVHPRRRGGQHPRAAPLPVEEQAARAAAGHRAARLRAPRPPDGPRGAGTGLHLVLGLRHRGDADPAGPRDRAGRLHPRRPHHPGHPRASSSS